MWCGCAIAATGTGEQRFVIEGKRELAAAAAARFPLQTLFYCEDFLADATIRRSSVGSPKAGPSANQPAERCFEKMSYRHTPDGLLAVAGTPSITLDELPEPPPGLALADRRRHRKTRATWAQCCGSADAVGAHGVLVADPSHRCIQPECSAGQRRGAIQRCHRCRLGAGVAGLVGRATAFACWRRARMPARTMRWRTFAAASRWRWAANRAGLDTDWLDDCQTVRIPMLGRLDSINAAMAAAVLLFEAQRQTHASELRWLTRERCCLRPHRAARCRAVEAITQVCEKSCLFTEARGATLCPFKAAVVFDRWPDDAGRLRNGFVHKCTR